MAEVFHLGPFMAMNAGTLPLGFRQRLSLACAVMHQPPVLFLDEPTSGVDPLVRREFWNHITALVLAREWERGTMEAILATPLSMGELLMSKVLPYYALGLGALVMCSGVSLVLFEVPFRGSVLALFAIASCYLYCVLGQGLMISALTRSQFVASQIALLTAFLPSLLLSGFIYEIASAPQWVQWVTRLVPTRYLIPALQTVFLAGDDWALFLPDMAMMLLFGSVFFLITWARSKRRVA